MHIFATLGLLSVPVAMGTMLCSPNAIAGSGYSGAWNSVGSTNGGKTYNRVSTYMQLEFDRDTFRIHVVANRISVTQSDRIGEDPVANSVTVYIHSSSDLGYKVDPSTCEVITHPDLDSIELNNRYHFKTNTPVEVGFTSSATNKLMADAHSFFNARIPFSIEHVSDRLPLPVGTILASPQVKDAGKSISMFEGRVELRLGFIGGPRAYVAKQVEFRKRSIQDDIEEANQYWVTNPYHKPIPQSTVVVGPTHVTARSRSPERKPRAEPSPERKPRAERSPTRPRSKPKSSCTII